MEINYEKNTVEIDLTKSGVYVVKDGHPTTVTPREHGEDKIVWQNGKVLDVVRTERFRLQGQKEI